MSWSSIASPAMGPHGRGNSPNTHIAAVSFCAYFVVRFPSVLPPPPLSGCCGAKLQPLRLQSTIVPQRDGQFLEGRGSRPSLPRPFLHLRGRVVPIKLTVAIAATIVVVVGLKTVLPGGRHGFSYYRRSDQRVAGQ